MTTFRRDGLAAEPGGGWSFENGGAWFVISAEATPALAEALGTDPEAGALHAAWDALPESERNAEWLESRGVATKFMGHWRSSDDAELLGLIYGVTKD